MGDAVILQEGDGAGLLRACQHGDGGGLFLLLVFQRLPCVVHVHAAGVGHGEDSYEAQFGDFNRHVKEVVDADDVPGLQLVGQSGGKGLYGKGDGHLAGGDAVQRRIGRYGYGADFGGEDVIPREEVCRGIESFYIVQGSGGAGGEVVAAHLHSLCVVRIDDLPFQDGGGDADDFCLAVGLPCDDGQGHKGGDGCQQEAQQAEDKAVVQFHGYGHSCSVLR